jgi:ATP-dependent RNA helicase RhlE
MPYQTQRRSFGRQSNGGGMSRRPGQSFGGGRRNTGGSRRGPKKDYIHPSRFVQAAKAVEREEYVATHQFVDFEVSDLIKNNLTAKGFVTPSPIQDQTIPLLLSGCDVIGIANTGTGKTAAFAIPTIHKLMTQPMSKALIIAPTRELAQQIEQECKEIGKGSRITGALLIGGSSMMPQLRDLRNNPRIVIGTPGRIKDHIDRGTLKLADFDIAILDEVDRMLDMGFVNDVTEILSNLATERQALFFSATMEPRVTKLIDTFSHDPVTVSVKQGEASENVHQDIVAYETSSDKITQLHNILVDQKVEKVIIFDDTQRSVERLSNELIERGFKADAIHGGKSQGQRQRALSRFKRSEISVLVATDVAARGIDVADITHVINFSTPQSYEDYVHRIGRAGRAGKIGHALTFVNG